MGCEEERELNVMRGELSRVKLLNDVSVRTSTPSVWLRWMREEERVYGVIEEILMLLERSLPPSVTHTR